MSFGGVLYSIGWRYDSIWRLSFPSIICYLVSKIDFLIDFLPSSSVSYGNLLFFWMISDFHLFLCSNLVVYLCISVKSSGLSKKKWCLKLFFRVFPYFRKTPISLFLSSSGNGGAGGFSTSSSSSRVRI